MCKIYNTIGCLTYIKSHLNHHNIHDFNSLKDIVDFQNSYLTHRQQLISKHENLIEIEKNELQLDLKHLEELIERQKSQIKNELLTEIDRLKQKLNISTNYLPTNYIQRFTKFQKQWFYKLQIQYNESNFDSRVNKSIKKLIDLQRDKKNRYQFIISHFSEAVKQSCNQPLTQLERKKVLIDEVNTFIAGAIGEQRVVNELERLSDEYYLINDFSISFSAPIYNRQEKNYIKSIQIDHILVAPSGIFLIETKNWNDESLRNLSLRSPVQQIKRTSFVIFKLLKNKITDYQLNLDKHHWGEKKISTRNLIVMTNSKPREVFEHVKIITLNELLGYVKYFKPTLSNNETQKITDYLLAINNQKVIEIVRN